MGRRRILLRILRLSARIPRKFIRVRRKFVRLRPRPGSGIRLVVSPSPWRRWLPVSQPLPRPLPLPSGVLSRLRVQSAVARRGVRQGEGLDRVFSVLLESVLPRVSSSATPADRPTVGRAASSRRGVSPAPAHPRRAAVPDGGNTCGDPSLGDLTCSGDPLHGGGDVYHHGTAVLLRRDVFRIRRLLRGQRRVLRRRAGIRRRCDTPGREKRRARLVDQPPWATTRERVDASRDANRRRRPSRRRRRRRVRDTPSTRAPRPLSGNPTSGHPTRRSVCGDERGDRGDRSRLADRPDDEPFADFFRPRARSERRSRPRPRSRSRRRERVRRLIYGCVRGRAPRTTRLSNRRRKISSREDVAKEDIVPSHQYFSSTSTGCSPRASSQIVVFPRL